MKIVTFVPPKSADEIRGALATGGAGIIGAYRLCSFASPGTGTFLGGEGSNPAVGESGRLERVDEVRLEMVCSRHALPIALKTLREFHPYEEPAIDVYELVGKPRRRVGSGRRLLLDRPASIGELCERIKTHLGRARVRYALPDDRATYATLGVVPGAGASMFDLAAADGCELFVTGEMKHHEIVAALHKGVGVLLAGHTNTERGYLPRLARRLTEALPGLDVRIAESDTDILTIG
ncbi:MAG: Nif3-like dinuclear metal center hexameric protein [Phycisphaerales bacterium]